MSKHDEQKSPRSSDSRESGAGKYGTDGREDRGSQQQGSKSDQHGYFGQHGAGPGGGQGHFGSSARISDQGHEGNIQRGAEKHERGSHGGARRNTPNPGPGGKGSGTE